MVTGVGTRNRRPANGTMAFQGIAGSIPSKTRIPARRNDSKDIAARVPLLQPRSAGTGNQRQQANKKARLPGP